MSNQRKLTFELPKPDADKILNTAFGRGMAEVIAEKQARIDRLERLIFCLYENVCQDVSSSVLYDDDSETLFYEEIAKKVKQLKSDLAAESQKVATIASALSCAEDTIQRLKRKNI